MDAAAPAEGTPGSLTPLGGVGAGLPIFRHDVSSGSNLEAIAKLDIGRQTTANVIIRATDSGRYLHPNFCYAVFGEDVSGTGSDLMNWSNSTFCPQNSTTANDVDLAARAAVIFLTTEDPEASTQPLWSRLAPWLASPSCSGVHRRSGSAPL